MRIAVILVLSLLPMVSYARIGETLDQLQKRWGHFSNFAEFTDSTEYYFAVEPLRLAVTIHNGRCILEEISKIEKSPFTSTEVQMLLRAEGNGLKWSRFSPENEIMKSYRSDRKVSVLDDVKNGVISFVDEDRVQEEQRAEESILKKF